MTEQPQIYVNLDGEVKPAAEVRVSVLDHGFLYGDSVYETVRTFHRRPFLLGRHLDRLERSLGRIFLALPVERERFEAEVLHTIDVVPIASDVGLRLVVSRGVGPLGVDISRCEQPSYLIYVFELSPEVQAGRGPLLEGVDVVVSKTRRNSPRALDPRIKSGNFLNNILAYKDARDAGAHEALLLGSEGFVAEGTTSNVFVVEEGVLRTPRTYGILDGITRAVLLEEARRAGVLVEEVDIPPEALHEADEVFISSSIRGIVPVVRVNGVPVGSGQRGRLTARLQELYAQRVELECGGGM